MRSRSSEKWPSWTLAIAKGRLFDPTVAFLKKLNMLPAHFADMGRHLSIDVPEQGLKILLLRAFDVPTYVEYGAADLGIVGSDLLMEQMKEVYEPLDLRFGQCRMVLAEPCRPSRAQPHRKRRVATKYPNVTERYFCERGLPVEMIKLYGSIELAPLLGLSDQIVDLSSTGETLSAHGLTVIDTLAVCSARLIVNRASLKLKHPFLQTQIHRIRDGIA